MTNDHQDANPVPSRAHKLQKPARELWTFAGLFVLEKHKGFLPGLIADPLGPIAEVGVTVIRTAQADVAPLRGGNKGDTQFVVSIGAAKGDIVLPDQGED